MHVVDIVPDLGGAHPSLQQSAARQPAGIQVGVLSLGGDRPALRLQPCSEHRDDSLFLHLRDVRQGMSYYFIRGLLPASG